MYTAQSYAVTVFGLLQIRRIDLEIVVIMAGNLDNWKRLDLNLQSALARHVQNILQLWRVGPSSAFLTFDKYTFLQYIHNSVNL